MSRRSRSYSFNNQTRQIFIGGTVVAETSDSNVAVVTGELDANAQSSITTLGTLDSLTATGNITTTSGFFVGNGSQLTGLPASYGNVNTNAYLTTNSYATEAYVNQANVGLKGYVDSEIAGLIDSAPDTLDTLNEIAAALGDDPNLATTLTTTITTANTILKSYVDGQITAANAGIIASNVGLKGYVDNEIANIPPSYSNTNVAAYLTTNSYATETYTDNAVTTANIGIIGYITDEITSANTGVVGYIDDQLTSYAVNVAIQGWTTQQITQANVGLKGYVDNEISGLIDSAPDTLNTLNEIANALGDDPNLATTLTNTITTANTTMKSYVDGQISAANTAVNSFSTIAILGQSNVVATSGSDALTLIAGTGIAITSNAEIDTLTIATVSSDGAFASDNNFGLVTDETAVTEDLGDFDSTDTEIDLGSIITAEGLIYPGQLVLPQYTVGTLPSAVVTAQLIYVSDETGGATMAFSDGTNWRRIQDRNIVS
jgi:hypothetical protein